MALQSAHAPVEILAMLGAKPKRAPFHAPEANAVCHEVLEAMREGADGDALALDLAAHLVFFRTFGTLPDPVATAHVGVTAEALHDAAVRAQDYVAACQSVAAQHDTAVRTALADPSTLAERTTLLATLGIPAHPWRVAASEWTALGRAWSHGLATNPDTAWTLDTAAPLAWRRLVVRQKRHLGRAGVPPQRTWFGASGLAGKRAAWPDSGRVVGSLSADERRALNRRLRTSVTQPALQLSLFQSGAPGDRAGELAERARSGGGYRQAFVRRSSGKLRRLDVPDDDLAGLQREFSQWLSRVVTLPAEVMGFMPRRSVVTHARRHAGARAAAIVDIADFFGSVRPHQVEHGLSTQHGLLHTQLERHDPQVRRNLVDACFRWPDGAKPYLPQGAPSSPMLANIAARRLDAHVVQAARAAFGPGRFTYSRYADDLALSTQHDIPDFGRRARGILETSIQRMGWMPSPEKSRVWRAGAAPLLLCGIALPASPSGELRLSRDRMREVRALVHRIRTGELRLTGTDAFTPAALRASGTLAWLYAVTGEPCWLAFGSRHVRALAHQFGMDDARAPAFYSGWLDASS